MVTSQLVSYATFAQALNRKLSVLFEGKIIPVLHKFRLTGSFYQMVQGVLMSHPSVDDCTVQEFNIEGVGSLPRAYVVMKSGYSATADDLIQYVESRVDEASRLRAGIVFVDKLAKDPSGKLFIRYNLCYIVEHIIKFCSQSTATIVS